MLLGQVCCLILIFISRLKIIAPGQFYLLPILLFHICGNVKAQCVRNAKGSHISYLTVNFSAKKSDT